MKSMHGMKPETGKIAITGISGIFPGAGNIEQFCHNILNKKEAIIDIPQHRWIVPQDSILSSEYIPDTACSKKAGIIRDFKFNPCDFNIDKDLLTGLDPLHKMVLSAGRQALSGSYNTEKIREKTGVIIAAISLPTEKSSETAWQICMEKNPGPLTRADALSAGVVSIPAALLARAFGLKGGSYTLDAACASSLFSIKLACDELLTGKCDMMIAGGVARPDSLYTQIGFTQLHALSASGRCSAFDKNADGLVVGEGTGLLVLKRIQDAVKCGDKIWGVICGTGVSNDIEGSLISPASEGQIRAMETAFKNAAWSPGDIQLVECHGSGTPVGDLVELNSMKTLWEKTGCLEKPCSIGSIKSMTGHLLTAAGAAGMIKTLIGMDKKILPPSLNFSSPPENSPLHSTKFKVQTEPEEWKPSPLGNNKSAMARRAGISAFGFGGINAHILVEEFKPGNGKKFFLGNGKHLSYEILRKSEAYFKLRCEAGQGQRPALPHGSYIENNEKHDDMERDPSNSDISIAIVGMETIIGSAHNLKEFQHLVLSGKRKSPEKPGKRWRIPEARVCRLLDLGRTNKKLLSEEIYGYWIKEISSFPGEFHIPPNQINDLLPQHLLMLKAAKGALADAGISMRPNDNEPLRTRFGAAFGIEFDYRACDFHLRWRLNNCDEAVKNSVSPALTSGRTLGALGGIVASRIAREFKIGGPCFTVSSGSASGLKAVEAGIRSLKSKETDVFLCGSVDMAGDVSQFVLNHISKSFSKNGDPLSSPQAFDKKSKGEIPCEGAAAIVLKPLEMAKKDGDRIYGIIKGHGSSSGAVMAFEAEDCPAGVSEKICSMEELYSLSLNRAMNNAGISFDSLGLYEAHGSGNRTEDRIEAESLSQYLNNKKTCSSKNTDLPCALGSAMAAAGNAKAVSGLLSLIKAALALYNQIIPPVCGFTSPEFDKWKESHFYIPKDPCFWIKNKDKEKRYACAASMTMDGTCSHAVIEEYVPEIKSADPYWIGPDHIKSDPIEKERRFPLGIMDTGLFIAEADSENGLVKKLESLNTLIKDEIEKNININSAQIAETWFKCHGKDNNKKFCISIVAENINTLVNTLIPEALHAVKHQTQKNIAAPASEGIFYTLNPLGKKGRTAFLYPGSGNHFPGMGRKIGVLFPEIFRSMEEQGISLKKCLLPEIYYPMRVSWEKGWEKDAFDKIKAHSHNMIFGQVLFGSLITRVAEKFKIKPDAAIGHSLGETASLFALNVWDNPGEMLERMEKSDLFTKKLAGDFTEAAKLWNLPRGIKPEWRVAAVNRSREAIRAAIKKYDRLYILIVNTPEETVIGGSHDQLKKFIRDTGCGALFLDGVVSVHCEIAESVRDEYQKLHEFACHPPKNIDFYSCSLGKKYIPETRATAMSIVNQAVYGFDYAELINTAWNDGIRVFMEMGPGSSCTRFVNRILRKKDHVAFSLSSKDEDEEVSVLKVLAALACHRVNVDISPLFHINGHGKINTRTFTEMQDKTICAQGIQQTSIATSRAHEKFLSLSQENMAAFNEQFKALTNTAAALINLENHGYSLKSSPAPLPLFTKQMCMEFATGSAAAVFGEKFKIVDSYPVRVRLPDAPLMLVDRIMEIKGDMLSLKNGAIVTQHDVKKNAWYLDGGRAPVSISIEAGQADLVLCSWLGIDHAVKGKRRYRLLDAKVAFHRPLPIPGETIEYRIKIDRFLKQGEIYLFFFHYKGYINKELFISMRDGCAGFFTPYETENSLGIVLKKDDLNGVADTGGIADTGGTAETIETIKPAKSDETHNNCLKFHTLVPVKKESYNDEKVQALRRGELEECFGRDFKGILLGKSLRLPDGRMHLIDRVTEFDPWGGRFKSGFIAAEADIKPDAWFLTCHFIDDRVMPGTLMYECCAHALRIFTQRMGWVSKKDTVHYDIIPGLESDLKCRGPVTPETKKAAYEIEIKEMGYDEKETPYVIADAHMFADGHRIVFYKDMGIKINGLFSGEIENLWKEYKI